MHSHMTNTVTFFSTEEDLQALTGLTHDQLWDADFNLDDWDFGFVSDTEWSEPNLWFSDREHPYYQYWLLTRMEQHCVGYEHTAYGGRHYYMSYHS